MSRVRVAVVGCGAIARRAHLPALTGNPHVEVVGICDPDEGARRGVKQRVRGLDCKEYRRLEDMLDEAAPDAVDICTPGYTHHELARTALNAGVHVLVEKPPGMCMGEARDLVDLAKLQQRKIGTVLNSRRKDIIVSAKDALDRGVLGEILKIQVVHHANIVFSESPALWDERTSKYLLYEFGIHLLDLMVYFCGPHVEVLHVHSTRQDVVETTTGLDILVRFTNGALGSMDITCDSTRHSSYFTQINLFGTGMDAFIRYFPPSVRFAAGLHDPLEILREELRSIASVAWKVGTGKFIKYRNQTHRLVLDAFVNWLRGEGTFCTDLESVLPTMALLDDIAEGVPAYRT